MKHKLLISLAVVAATLTGPALAEDFSNSGKKADAVTASPFDYARSGAKAERAKAADAAGAKVIGGEIAAEGAWPWQVALLVGGAPVSSDAQFCGGSMVMN